MRPLPLAALALLLAACGPGAGAPEAVPNADPSEAASGPGDAPADFPDTRKDRLEAAPPGDDAPPGEPPESPAR